MDIQTKTDIIHQKIYDFLLYIYPLLTKYPKYEKFSLQTATRNAILEMLQEVIKWDKTATKSHLYTVDTALQESKELLRLAHDLKYSAMNARHYGESCRSRIWGSCLLTASGGADSGRQLEQWGELRRSCRELQQLPVECQYEHWRSWGV